MHKNISIGEDKLNVKHEKDVFNEGIVSSVIENIKEDLNIKDDSCSKSSIPTSSNEAELNASFKEVQETVSQNDTNDNDCDDMNENVLRDRDLNISDEEKKKLMEESQIYKNDGNKHYLSADYNSSITLYTQALHTCPLQYFSERSIMYCNRAASKIKLELKAEAIKDCTKAIELNEHYVKAYFRRAKLYEETDKLDEALADYNKLIELDSTNKDAISASFRLTNEIKEKNEKLKEEMLGKLKDVGNTLLRPFGLSTNNFQMNKDPNTGNFTVNFVQNKN